MVTRPMTHGRLMVGGLSQVPLKTGGLGTTDPKVHGYLPFGIAWYRKHFTVPSTLSNAAAMYIDFEGVQTKSQVWLNGKFLGSWDYGQ